MKRLLPYLCTTVCAGLLIGYSAGAAESISVLLQKAIFAEETEGNLDAAIKIYEGIVKEGESNRPLVAQAQYRLGICFQKKGSKDQAVAALRRLLAEFPNERMLHEKAQALLRELGFAPDGELIIRKLPDPLAGIQLLTARTISRDGRYLLTYQGMLDLTTGDVRKFEHFEKSQFTPDGKKIVGSRRFTSTNPVVVLDLESGRFREIRSNPDLRDVYWYMDVSSDSKNILAVFDRTNRTSQLVIISIDTGAVRILKTFDTNSYVTDLRFSPDAKWVAYGSTKSGATKSLRERDGNIYVLAVDGSHEAPLVDHSANDQLLGWAPFGDQILFASDRRGTWDAFLIHVLKGKPIGEPVLVKASVSSGPPAYADTRTGVGFTDSGAFYYISENDSSDVYIVALDPVSGKVRGSPIKATGMESPNEHPAWSRDGRSLAYITRRGAGATADGFIRIRDMETGAIRELPTDAGRVSFPKWSPDGKSIYAVAYHPPDAPAYRIDAASGKSTNFWADLTSLWYGSWPVWSWAPDGKSFYQQNGFTKVTRHDIETGAKQDFPIPVNRNSTVVSPNCELLAYSVTKTNGSVLSRTINVAPLRGGEPRELVELTGLEAIDSVLRGGHDRGLGWTPDNRHVLYVRGNRNNPKARELWRVAVAGGEPENLGLAMDGLRTLAVSPDGRWLAFAAGGNKAELWVMENFLPKEKVAAK
jgi:Tol biopolymer transport system component